MRSLNQSKLRSWRFHSSAKFSQNLKSETFICRTIKPHPLFLLSKNKPNPSKVRPPLASQQVDTEKRSSVYSGELFTSLCSILFITYVKRQITLYPSSTRLLSLLKIIFGHGEYDLWVRVSSPHSSPRNLWAIKNRVWRTNNMIDVGLYWRKRWFQWLRYLQRGHLFVWTSASSLATPAARDKGTQPRYETAHNLRATPPHPNDAFLEKTFGQLVKASFCLTFPVRWARNVNLRHCLLPRMFVPNRKSHWRQTFSRKKSPLLDQYKLGLSNFTAFAKKRSDWKRHLPLDVLGYFVISVNSKLYGPVKPFRTNSSWNLFNFCGWTFYVLSYQPPETNSECTRTCMRTQHVQGIGDQCLSRCKWGDVCSKWPAVYFGKALQKFLFSVRFVQKPPKVCLPIGFDETKLKTRPTQKNVSVKKIFAGLRMTEALQFFGQFFLSPLEVWDLSCTAQRTHSVNSIERPLFVSC